MGRYGTWLLWGVLALAAGCAPDPSDMGPSDALSAFLVALDDASHRPARRQEAYAWLDEDSRQELAERAEVARSLAGRDVEPWEMLVPGRLALRARSLRPPQMRSSVDGDRATVRVKLEGRPDVEVPLVRQDGRWRVVLQLPPVP